ncbi:MAG: Ig-like domain-containing protein [Candidatus Hydrogenedentes bacterium]|nr:Ig-like domain-containing protein [Candidatus Hydrogenedentota bacterium]
MRMLSAGIVLLALGLALMGCPSGSASPQISISPRSAELEVGQSTTFTASSSDSADSFTWASDNTAVAGVSNQGRVTAVGEGTARITATSARSGAKATATVVVVGPAVEPGAVTVTPSAATIVVGGSVRLEGVTSGDPVSFLWFSNDESIVTVNASGLVTGVGPGTVTVEVRVSGGAPSERAEATITVVEPAVHSVLVRPLGASILVGETVALSALSTDPEDEFEWSTEFASTATVSTGGLVTGAGPGGVVINARGTHSGAIGSSVVTVSAPAEHQVTISPTTLTLSVGDTVVFKGSTTREDGILNWSSDNPAIASVGPSGAVTGTGVGVAAIVVEGSGPSERASAMVRVLEGRPRIASVRPVSSSIPAGESIALTATSSDIAERFTWTSDATGIATVDDAGVVTGVAAGEARITAVGQTTGATGQAIVLVTAAVPHRMAISPAAASLEVGEMFRFKAASTRAGDRIEWTSDDEAVATVSPVGVVTGAGAGAATITATGLDSGVSASAAVTVSEPVAHAVEVHPLAATIAPGETVELTASSTEPDDRLEWFAENEDIATVGLDGVVTGVAPGVSAVVVRGDLTGEEASAQITVAEPTVHEMRVLPRGATVEEGDSVQLSAASTRDGDLPIWTTSNAGVATVNGAGLVTGVAEGTAAITATGSLTGAADDATITVTPREAEVALIRPIEASVLVGEIVEFSAESSDPEESFLWESSNAAVASVDAVTGVAAGVAAGSATITATGQNTGATGSGTVLVSEPVVHEVSVTPSEVLLVAGDTIQLTASSTRAGDSFTWSSSASGVASVNATGLVSAATAGDATITAQGGVPNERATARVTVVDPVVHTVSVQPRNASITAGAAIQFSATSTDPLDSFTWTSSNGAVATVDAAGLVTGLGGGGAEIRARGTHSGVTATATIAVAEAEMEFVAVLPQTATVEVSATLSLSATSTVPGDTFAWSSSNSAIATVSASGVVSGMGVGTVNITATGSVSGLSASSAVTVIDTVPPTVAIGPPSVAATRSGPVEFQVAYSGASAVTLTRDDVNVHATGSVTALLGDVVVAGATSATVRFTSIAGNGTLGISIDAGTATDPAGNLAPAAGPSATVLVDNIAPALSIGAPSVTHTRSGPINYRVSYSGADQITLTKANVFLNASEGIAATLGDVQTTGAAERTVTFTSVSGNGNLGISIDAGTARDTAGNEAPAAGPSATVVVDNTPPTVMIGAPSATTTNTGPLSFRVTYGGASAITLAAADVVVNSTGSVVTSLPTVTETGANERTVTFETIGGDGALGISLAAGTAADEAGNQAPAAGPSAQATIDNTPPTVAIGAPSVAVTSAGPVVYPVTYTGASAVTLRAQDITINGTNTAFATVQSVADAGGGVWIVTLASVIGNGQITISLAQGTAADTAGNPAPAAGPSAAFTVNNVAPTLAISAPSAENTFEGPVTYTITYADAAAVALAPADITLNSADGVTASIAVTGTGTAQRTVTLSNIAGLGHAGISIAAATATNTGGTPANAAGPSETFRVNPLLEAGTGFTQPTPQPDPIGDPGDFGIDAKAIARWDVVPYQTFDAYFEIGVVAFHINGIDRVEFSVNNGPWTAVREMTLNPRTDVVEYWVGLDARDFADGPIEVRAVAYPVVGEARVLEGPQQSEKTSRGEFSLFLNTNANGTLPEIETYVSISGSDDSGDGSEGNPYRSIMRAARAIQDASPLGMADGGTIFLEAGEYRIGTYSFALNTLTSDRWLTIRPKVNLPKGAARIVGADAGGLRTKLVRLDSLSVTPASSSDQNVIRSSGPLEDYYWVSNCELIGPGREVNGQWVSGISLVFVSGTFVTNSRDGLAGAIVRNVRVESIGSDAFTGSDLVLNSSAFRLDNTGTPFHADVLQYFTLLTIENKIAYGVSAESARGQGFFAGNEVSIKDIAFVDCSINNQLEPNISRVFQFAGPTENLYVLRCMFNGPANWRTDLSFSAHNVVVEDTIFTNGGVQVSLPLVPGVEYR